MDNRLYFEKDKKRIAIEKRKAQELRKTQWWKQQVANGVCYYCKKTVNPNELTMDHIVPLARGGKSTKGNVVPCCKSCNSDKKYNIPSEIIIEQLKKEGDS